MKEEKRNKITAAITVNAVLFVFILVAIIIAQIVQISILNRRKKELQETYYELTQQLHENESLYDRITTDDNYYRFVLEYIDVYGDEDPFNILPDGVIIK